LSGDSPHWTRLVNAIVASLVLLAAADAAENLRSAPVLPHDIPCNAKTGKVMRYRYIADTDLKALRRWLRKARTNVWDMVATRNKILARALAIGGWLLLLPSMR
jgi:hypothetical protein